MAYQVKEKADMREILCKSLTSVKNKRRVLYVSERTEDKKSITRVHKVFIYLVKKIATTREELPEPILQIVKTCDTKTKEETICYRVKGGFYVVNNDQFLEVIFCHSLRVEIVPKVTAVSAVK
ncbi:MAG: hypothetical protein WC676_00040 [Candidatus Omnitrophota bacterium]